MEARHKGRLCGLAMWCRASYPLLVEFGVSPAQPSHVLTNQEACAQRFLMGGRVNIGEGGFIRHNGLNCLPLG